MIIFFDNLERTKNKQTDGDNSNLCRDHESRLLYRTTKTHPEYLKNCPGQLSQMYVAVSMFSLSVNLNISYFN